MRKLKLLAVALIAWRIFLILVFGSAAFWVLFRLFSIPDPRLRALGIIVFLTLIFYSLVVMAKKEESSDRIVERPGLREEVRRILEEQHHFPYAGIKRSGKSTFAARDLARLYQNPRILTFKGKNTAIDILRALEVLPHEREAEFFSKVLDWAITITSVLVNMSVWIVSPILKILAKILKKEFLSGFSVEGVFNLIRNIFYNGIFRFVLIENGELNEEVARVLLERVADFDLLVIDGINADENTRAILRVLANVETLNTFYVYSGGRTVSTFSFPFLHSTFNAYESILFVLQMETPIRTDEGNIYKLEHKFDEDGLLHIEVKIPEEDGTLAHLVLVRDNNAKGFRLVGVASNTVRCKGITLRNVPCYLQGVAQHIANRVHVRDEEEFVELTYSTLRKCMEGGVAREVMRTLVKLWALTDGHPVLLREVVKKALEIQGQNMDFEEIVQEVKEEEGITITIPADLSNRQGILNATYYRKRMMMEDAEMLDTVGLSSLREMGFSDVVEEEIREHNLGYDFESDEIRSIESLSHFLPNGTLPTFAVRKENFPSTPLANLFTALRNCPPNCFDEAVKRILFDTTPTATSIHLKTLLIKKLENYTDWQRDPTFADELAGAYNNRGIAYRNRREYDRAIEDYTRAIGIWENYTDWQGNPTFADELAGAYNNRGIAYYDRGNLEEACRDWRVAYDIWNGMCERRGMYCEKAQDVEERLGGCGLQG